MRLIALALTACVSPGDYRDPLVGGQAAAAVQQCHDDRYQPCGWVYAFPSTERDNPIGALELCILWPDRIGPYPTGLIAAAESLYGEAVLSWSDRFAGTPLCRYQCPGARGCNAFDSCFCLDGAR